MTRVSFTAVPCSRCGALPGVACNYRGPVAFELTDGDEMRALGPAGPLYDARLAEVERLMFPPTVPA